MDRAGDGRSGWHGDAAQCTPRRWGSPRRSCCCGWCRPALRGGSAGRCRRAATSCRRADAVPAPLARKTWGFFETYVNAEDNWLPPDNVQENPRVVIAHRTSPTNMGLALLADLAAYDFGYLSGGQLVDRTDERAAHDGVAGAPPRPLLQLVRHAHARAAAASLLSTVDSGNLAGHLLTLRAGLFALADHRSCIRAGSMASATRSMSWRESIGRHPPLGVDRGFGRARSARPKRESRRVCLDAHRRADPHAADDRRALSRRVTDAARSQAPSTAAAMCADSAPGWNCHGWAQALARQCAELARRLRCSSRRGSQRQTAKLSGRCARRWRLGAAIAARASAAAATRRATRRARRAARRDRARPRARRAHRRDRTAGAAGRRTGERSTTSFLFDKARHLLVDRLQRRRQRARMRAIYDLLASEARLASFVAIAQGKLPQESWFALGRLLTTAGGEPVLLSWSGSMFEYLMPLLVMPTYENTLLDQTYIAAVERQIDYGRQRGVPWGISECGYNTVDAHDQLSVPRLRRAGARAQARPRRRSGHRAVCLGARADGRAGGGVREPAAARRRRAVWARYGMYEAIDYTPSRQRARRVEQRSCASFMAHHQGMSLLAFSLRCCSAGRCRSGSSPTRCSRRRCCCCRNAFRAQRLSMRTRTIAPDLAVGRASAEPPIRVLTTPNTPVPEVHLLSNGRYHVMVTNAGGGSSRWKDFAVTRWREDTHLRQLGHVLLPARRRER